MKIYAMANFKGGVGKTATACNLAALLAREGERVLLIDADAQHNASDFFSADTDWPTLTDVLEGTCQTIWSDNIQPTGWEGLDMLPADMRLLTLDLAAILHGADASSKRLFDLLDCAREDGDYDYVLIDCPPSFTTASVAALVCCDEVILPTKADAFSRAGALELIEQVRSLGRFHVSPRFRVLVTMVDRSRLTRQAEEQLRSDGLEVFSTVIHSSVCVGESTYTRLPLYEYAPRSRAALDFEELLKEVLADGR
jgi:chromosome partitioning protein